MLKLENKYDTVNKTYFKEMKYVDWFSWNRYKSSFRDREDYFLIGLAISLIALPSILFIICGLPIGNNKEDPKIFPLLIGLFMLIVVGVAHLLTKSDDEYKNINDSFYVQLPGDKEPRYYSRWYLDICNINLTELALRENNGFPYYMDIRNNFKIKRESDRKHWKNNIPENRVLTWSEYKKYKKGKLKQQELLEQAEYIKEFKEYYGLEVKEIEEIIK